MNKKNSTLILFALVAALFTFACLGGAGVAATATSVPPQPTEATQAPTEPVTHEEGKVEIKSSSSYIDSFNDYTVAGEIINNTDSMIENVTLSLSITDESGASLLKDENDNPVDSIDIQPYLPVLLPGASAPFNYYISADEVQPAKYEVSVKSYDQSSAAEPMDISIENVYSTDLEGGNVVIAGELVNTSSRQVDVEALAGSVLDDAGNVLAANSTLTYSRYLYPAGDAAGRDRSPFLVKMFGPVSNATQWKVYARAIENTTTPSADMEIQLADSYIDSYGSYHLLGTIKNTGASQISPSLIGGLYNADKTVFDAASLNIPLYLNAGDSAPFDLNTFQIIGYLPSDEAAPAEKVVQPDLYWTFNTDYEVVTLDAKNVNITQDGSSWTVTGAAFNTSGKNLSSISAVIAFVDENGQVLATNSTSIYPPDGSDTVEPNTSNEFSISVYVPADWNLSSKEYQVILQGVVSE